jgi:dephospho-CoA kinase
MIVGLTGGIGSGKSTVAQIFEVLGCPIYNSDERAKEMYYLPEVKEQVIRVLGKEAYYYDGKINKDFISLKIFNDPAFLGQINGIIHPAVGLDFARFLEEHKEAKLIIKESALLFEANLLDKVDKLILVTAPHSIKVERLKKRDNSTEEQINDRIKNQLPDEKKLEQSDFVIENDEQKPLIPQVLKVYRQLLNA